MKRLLLTIEAVFREALTVSGSEEKIVMITFSGTAHSEHFSGEITGTGTDTQKYDLKSGECSFSARYMLQGTDKNGQKCRIFIENQQQNNSGWLPKIVTDSQYLRSWETLPLTASVDADDKGVTVRIYTEQA